MTVDSLVELKSVFDTWRDERRNIRVPIPHGLIERAKRAATVHGPTAVRAATRIPARHILAAKPGVVRRATQRVGQRKDDVAVVPAFSRLEVSASIAPGRPLAEVETASGIKLRIFTVTTETLGLANAFCGKGVAQ